VGNQWHVIVNKQSFGTINTIASSGVLLVDFSTGNNFTVTLESNSTFAGPVNASGGQCGAITIRQDNTGSRTLAYSGGWAFQGGTAPTLTTAASGIDVLAYFVVAPTRVVVFSLQLTLEVPSELTPSSFTEVSATTGQLIPLAYSGTYGTNGFQLKFADNSAATAATLGADTSGNGNNWTPNNLSTSTGGPTSVAAASGALPVFNTTDTYGTVKGTGTRTDTNSASIVLALPMDGTNGGTSFGDQSAVIKGSGSAKTVTVNGNSNTSTAQSKFYGSSGLFDGTGDFLGITPTTDFALPGDFTIEAWMYSALSANNAIFSIGSYTSGLYFRTGEGGDLTKITIFINNSQVALSASGAIKASQWTHVTVVRAGSTVTIYVNGVSVVSGTSSFSIPSDTTYVGRAVHSTGEDMNGYLQDVRVYKGVAKYTSNFNPPSATANATVAAGNDSLVDTPTSYGTPDTGVGGEVRGNYATLNPLDKAVDVTLSNGNLEISHSGSSNLRAARATIKLTAGKWYCEAVRTTGSDCHSGIITAASSLFQFASTSVFYGEDGNLYVDGSVATNYGITIAIGDVVGIAVDMDAAKIYFYKNGTLINTGGTSFTTTGNDWFFKIGTYFSSSVNTVNFGQRAFAYPVSGYKALVDTNLPAPLTAKSNTVFDIALWTGTGVGARAITGLNFNPDLVWLKRRSSTGTSNQLHDVVRTASAGALYSDLTNAEDSNYPLTSFDTAGFTLGSSASLASQSYASQNETSQTYVGWTWDAGTSTVTNTAGSITSQVRANVSAGFSVVTYTGNAVSGATVGHGLGVAPSLIIFKCRGATHDWIVYHASIGNTGAVRLNTTAATQTLSVWFNNSGPSSTTFTLGNTAGTNESGSAFVAYAFAPVVGYSSFGSYTGNGDADGPFIYTGFRPKFFMHKDYTAGGAGRNWLIWDAARETYNAETTILFANDSGAEATNAAHAIDFVSNGIKIRNANANINPNGVGFIYMAFAENPLQYARAR
jgi:hypothetical protein